MYISLALPYVPSPQVCEACGQKVCVARSTINHLLIASHGDVVTGAMVLKNNASSASPDDHPLPTGKVGSHLRLVSGLPTSS
jgi:hypothetical protein